MIWREEFMAEVPVDWEDHMQWMCVLSHALGCCRDGGVPSEPMPSQSHMAVLYEVRGTEGDSLANSSGSPSIWCGFVTFLLHLQLLVYCGSPADCQLTLDAKECCHVSWIYCVSHKLLFLVAKKLDDGIFFSACIFGAVVWSLEENIHLCVFKPS